jgi:hypothetical protein
LEKKGKVEPFDQILLESIDEALLSLGEGVKVSIFYHLQDLFRVRKEEIPQKIEFFSDALEKIFGIGARQLEILFMKNLHSKLTLTCKWPNECKWIIPNLTFKEYIALMRQEFEKTNVNDLEVFVDAGEQQKQHY